MIPENDLLKKLHSLYTDAGFKLHHKAIYDKLREAAAEYKAEAWFYGDQVDLARAVARKHNIPIKEKADGAVVNVCLYGWDK
jgi:hypothetical protein